MDKKPEYLLWHVVKNEMKLFSRKEVYSHHITNIIKKYTGKSINNNTIRKIWETSLIQSPEYNQMTNNEKDKAHKKLLHSTSTANEVYNKVHEKMRQMKLCDRCGQVATFRSLPVSLFNNTASYFLFFKWLFSNRKNLYFSGFSKIILT